MWQTKYASAVLRRPYLKIWEWELIFGRAVKAISSPGRGINHIGMVGCVIKPILFR